MRATATATVVAIGVLTVSVSAPAKGYNGVAISVSASWNGGAIGPFLGQFTWGDGAYDAITRQSGKSITKTHTYTTNGTYTITVAVSDEGTLASGSGTASIQIAAQLAASLSASPTSGNIPLAVTFTIGASGGFTPYTGTLAYGDNVTDTVLVPGTKAHTYTTVGNFTATLTVTDALGASVISRSRLTIGPTGVTVEPWASALAPLVAGLVLIAVAKR